MIFCNKRKPNFKYVGPYRIIKGDRDVSNELYLAPRLTFVYPLFHITLLKECVCDPGSIITLDSVGDMDLIIPLESVVVKDSLTYEEFLVENIGQLLVGLKLSKSLM